MTRAGNHRGKVVESGLGGDAKVFQCAAAVRDHKVCFGSVVVIEIDSENNGTKPNTSRDLTYSHSHDYSLMDPRVAHDVAISKATHWHTAICREYGLPAYHD